jgi:hypothetical protein
VAHGSTRGSLTEGAWLTLRALAALLLAIGFYVAVLTLVGVLLFIAGTGLFYGKLLFLKVPCSSWRPLGPSSGPSGLTGTTSILPGRRSIARRPRDSSR